MNKFDKLMTYLKGSPIKSGLGRLDDERHEYEDRIASLEKENAKLRKRLDVLGDAEFVIAALRSELSELREAAARFIDAYDNEGTAAVSLALDDLRALLANDSEE